jgi:hypothetical protein
MHTLSIPLYGHTLLICPYMSLYVAIGEECSRENPRTSPPEPRCYHPAQQRIASDGCFQVLVTIRTDICSIITIYGQIVTIYGRLYGPFNAVPKSPSAPINYASITITRATRGQ